MPSCHVRVITHMSGLNSCPTDMDVSKSFCKLTITERDTSRVAPNTAQYAKAEYFRGMLDKETTNCPCFDSLRAEQSDKSTRRKVCKKKKCCARDSGFPNQLQAS